MESEIGSGKVSGFSHNLQAIAIAAKWGDVVCIDLSVPLSNELPVSWPTLPAFRKSLVNWFEDYTEPTGAVVRSKGYFYDQALYMDEHCGTHIDFPSHVLPPVHLQQIPGNPLQVTLKTFVGPCAVVDAREYLDKAKPGTSPRISADTLERWEEHNASYIPTKSCCWTRDTRIGTSLHFPRGSASCICR
jgi:kynurenine formamidase